MTFISRRWPKIHTGFPQKHVPGWNGSYGSSGWHKCTRWNWWTGRCPLSPIFGHEEEEKKRRARLTERQRKVEDYESGDHESEEKYRHGLRYREPTQSGLKEFTREAIAAATSLVADQSLRGSRGPQEEEGERWRGLEGVPVLRPSGSGDDAMRVLLALALASALTGAAEILRRSGRSGSSKLVPQLEPRLSRGLQQQSQMRSPRGGGMGYRFNWAANLRGLLGASK